MIILIAGAGGYVGIPLCDRLRMYHSVNALDRFYFGKYPKCTIMEYDIRDIKDSQIAGTIYDCVIDLSGLSNDASCEIDNELTLSINCRGGVNLARMAKRAGVKRYIYSSSASVYGDGSGQLNLTEKSPTNPLTQYAKCKKSVEDELLELNGDGFEVVILRNSTIYGVAPRMRFDLAVNIMTARAWKEKVIYVMGGGEQWRPFVHVQDVVRAFEYVLTNGIAGEIYNIGGENMTVSQLAHIVSNMVDGCTIHHIPDNADNRSYNVDFSKIQELGFETKYCVRDGIKEVLTALKDGKISMDDPTCYTLQWYKSLIEWEKRIDSLKINGKVL